MSALTALHLSPRGRALSGASDRTAFHGGHARASLGPRPAVRLCASRRHGRLLQTGRAQSLLKSGDSAPLRLARAAAHDSTVDRPKTSYAWNDGTALAYQVIGNSGTDLLLIPGSVSHLEVLWQEPRVNRFLRRFAAFCRLIIMDPRGLGLSDRLTEIPTMEERVDNLLSVLDAAESERATLFGNADTGPPCIAAAVAHPERVGGLILCGTYAKASRSDDYSWGWTEEEWADFRRFVRDDWGTTVRADSVAPSMAGDTAFLQWSATLARLGASPRPILLLGR